MNTLEIPPTSLTHPTKTVRTMYWIATGLFAALMLADGFAGSAQTKDGQQAMALLGYPMYLMTIVGVAKILGAVALVQTRFPTLKEWAYAGFAFNFLGASASWFLAGQGAVYVLFPLVALALLSGTYFLWKRVSRS